MSEYRPSFRTVSGEVNVTVQEILTNNSVLVVGTASVSQDTLTTIATLPANGIKYVTQIICSGVESAKWDVFLDSVRKITLRTVDRNVVYNFPTPLKVLAAQVLDVKCTHHGTSASTDFEASILGYSTV
jgi:hypothetical protein